MLKFNLFLLELLLSQSFGFFSFPFSLFGGFLCLFLFLGKSFLFFFGGCSLSLRKSISSLLRQSFLLVRRHELALVNTMVQKLTSSGSNGSIKVATDEVAVLFNILSGELKIISDGLLPSLNASIENFESLLGHFTESRE